MYYWWVARESNSACLAAPAYQAGGFNQPPRNPKENPGSSQNRGLTTSPTSAERSRCSRSASAHLDPLRSDGWPYPLRVVVMDWEKRTRNNRSKFIRRDFEQFWLTSGSGYAVRGICRRRKALDRSARPSGSPRYVDLGSSFDGRLTQAFPGHPKTRLLEERRIQVLDLDLAGVASRDGCPESTSTLGRR